MTEEDDKPGAAPAIVASARDHVAIPVCVRFPATATAIATTRACFLAGPHVEHRLPAAAGCPAWVVGNDGGRGYYRTVWRGAAPLAPLAMLSPEERLARGDDAALAVRHGDLPVGAALGELASLAATGDPYGELAALAIARAIDPLVADPERPAWTAWLAARFADRLTPAALGAPGAPIDALLRRDIVALAHAGIPGAVLEAVRAELARRPDRAQDAILRVSLARDPDALFAGIVTSARAARTAEARAGVLEDLGAFPAGYAPRIVDLSCDRRLAAGEILPALVAMLERGETAAAAWQAIHARFATLSGAISDAEARDLLAATASLCDATARAEVRDDFTPRIAAAGDGLHRLDQALAAIDRCAARRAAAGSIASALAALPPAGGAWTPRP